MSVNLLELLQGQIGKQVIGQVGNILGESEENTTSAVGAALPSLVGGLMKQASTTQGAEDLNRQLDDQREQLLAKAHDEVEQHRDMKMMTERLVASFRRTLESKTSG